MQIYGNLYLYYLHLKICLHFRIFQYHEYVWSEVAQSCLTLCDRIDCSLGEGNGTPLQYSCLENPMDGGAWWAAVYGVAQSWTWLKWLSSSSRLFATRWTLAYQVPPSMGFSRQNFPGVDCHFLFQDLVNPGIEVVSRALASEFFTTEPPEKPLKDAQSCLIL